MAEAKTEQRGVMNKMRRNTIVVMWILVISFVGMIVFSWGMDLLGFRTPPQKGIIGIVNDQEIEYRFFASRLQNEIERYRTQMGTVPQSQFIRNLNENLWNEIVNTILFQNAIDDYNIMVTGEEIIQEIRYRPLPEFISNPQFQKEDGTFDQAKYEAALRADNTGVVLNLEQQMRQVIPQRKLQNLILSTVRVTEHEIRQAFSEEEQAVKIEYISLDRDNFSDSVTEPTDQEIRNYYQNNKDSFIEPETRQLKYVLFPTEPTKEDSAETDRVFRDVHQRALQNEDFAELATEYSMGPNADTGGLLGVFGRGTMLKDIDDALFNPGIKAGNVIGPIETNFGKQLFYIERIVKSGTQIDSVEARNILFRYEASETTTADAESKADYFSIVAQDEGFENAVQELGYSVYETASFAKGGFIPGFGVNRDISDFADYAEYDEDKPPASDAIETLQGFAVFMLFSVVEERTMEMDEVRDEIVQILGEQEMLQLANERMTVIKQGINSGTSFQDAVAQNALEIEEAEEYRFNDYLPDIGRNIKFASAAFALDPGGVSNPIEGTRAVYLIRMIEKQPFDEDRYTEMKLDIKNRLLQGKRMAVFNSWIMKLREKADIEDYRSFFYRLY